MTEYLLIRFCNNVDEQNYLKNIMEIQEYISAKKLVAFSSTTGLMIQNTIFEEIRNKKVMLVTVGILTHEKLKNIDVMQLRYEFFANLICRHTMLTDEDLYLLNYEGTVSLLKRAYEFISIIRSTGTTTLQPLKITSTQLAIPTNLQEKRKHLNEVFDSVNDAIFLSISYLRSTCFLEEVENSVTSSEYKWLNKFDTIVHRINTNFDDIPIPEDIYRRLYELIIPFRRVSDVLAIVKNEFNLQDNEAEKYFHQFWKEQ